MKSYLVESLGDIRSVLDLLSDQPCVALRNAQGELVEVTHKLMRTAILAERHVAVVYYDDEAWEHDAPHKQTFSMSYPKWDNSWGRKTAQIIAKLLCI